MIKKIIIDNFMAHERTELELGPGVTALTGPNNTGKSAIVEALRCVATNPVPKHYIRHGAKEARVTIELDDTTKVVWIRKKRSSGYELWKPGAEEPQEYWKFGRKPPEDILNALRLDLVELETGNEIDVHVGNQREPVFLLNQPPSNAAAFFAASTESAHLLAMQNLLKRRTQDANREKRDLETRINELETELDGFATLPDIALEVEKARELEITTKKLHAEIPALESLLASHHSLSETRLLKKNSTTIIKATIEPPILNEVRQLSDQISKEKALNHKLNSAQRVSQSLVQLAPLPHTHDTITLARLCDQLQSAENRLQKAQGQTQTLAPLSALPATENTAHLADLTDQIIALRYRQQRLATWDNVLQTVAEPPTTQSDDHLVRLLADMGDLEARKNASGQTLTALETDLQTVKENIKKRIDELGCCPTCGADLNTEAFIDRGCRHDS